jgi:hypothetical protein
LLKADFDLEVDDYSIGEEEELAEELMDKASLLTPPAPSSIAEETKTTDIEDPAKISEPFVKVAQGEDDEEEFKVVKGKVGGTTVPVA